MSDYAVRAINTEAAVGSRSRMKTFLGVPEWKRDLDLMSSDSKDKVTGSAAAFQMVPLIFRAVKLRCDAISQVPVHIFRGETEVPWPFATPRSELIWRTEAALLLEGLSVWLKLPNYQRPTDLQWLNPYTLDVRYEDPGGIKIRQTQGTANSGPWRAEQVVYFHEFNPLDDIGAGTSAAMVALEDAKLLRYLTRFAARYFETGAMPVTLLGFEYSPTEAERERVENWFKKMASGIGNAWKVLALRGKISPAVLTPPPKDLEMKELNNQARHNVAMAFGIPQTMLEDAANYATAGEHRLSFWQDTVKPRGPLYEDILNAQLFTPMGLRVQFNFEEMGVFQVDEAERSGALANLTQAGFDTLTAAEVLGYQLTVEQRKRIEGSKPQMDADEGDGSKEEDETIQEVPGQEETKREIASQKPLAMTEELKRWERKVLKRVKDGKRATVGFVCEAIPASLAGAIEGALEAAETAEDVKRVFDGARWEGYP